VGDRETFRAGVVLGLPSVVGFAERQMRKCNIGGFGCGCMHKLDFLDIFATPLNAE
jgi:hypothetical protein